MNKELKKLVSELNWKVPEDEVNSIVNKLGEKAEESKYGVRYYKVLMEIVCNKVDEELNLEEDEIKYKGLLLGGVAFTTASIMSSGGGVYYRIIVTNKKIYSYEFDYFFKLVGKLEYNINEVKSIKLAEQGQDNVIPYEGYKIEFNDGKYLILYSINKFSINKLHDLKDILVLSGVDYKKIKTKKFATIYYAIGVIAIISVIIEIIQIML